VNSNAALDFKSLDSMQNLVTLAAKWPLAIVALGLAFTAIWTATVLWVVVTAASAYAAGVASLFS